MRFISLFFSLFPILAMGQGFGFSDHVYLSPVPRVTQVIASGCGSPPVTGTLVQWLCTDYLLTQGHVDGDFITNWADVSPVGVNGVYWTNFFSTTTKPQLHTGGQNGNAYLLFGDNLHWAPMANSNAWWSGVTQAQCYYVIAGLNATWTAAGFETMGGSGQDEFLWDQTAGNHAKLGFGSTTRQDIGFGFKASPSGAYIFSMWSATNDWGLTTNGVVAYTTSANTVGWPANAGRTVIAFSLPSGYETPILLYELLVYTNKLSSNDDYTVVHWLKGKYAIP